MCQSIIFHTADFEAKSLPHRFIRRSRYPATLQYIRQAYNQVIVATRLISSNSLLVSILS
ncbi:hypothetical protein [Dendronalium sp. ChiSLP03b]|uniref:hypothetical protein n=1 Tax=Dendronalium sp. ChiSLP03b TaxID=3075381 RepID=UPI002AD49137|nr:hypothetical protein [Dendronalium sp. ChiSLP03b]MDZ8207116.1 hypothetical protein [Dendronalium sp. ChiSLP03b]